VDYPHVIELKETRLADEKPKCRLDRIKFNLTDRIARRRVLADVSAQAHEAFCRLCASDPEMINWLGMSPPMTKP